MNRRRCLSWAALVLLAAALPAGPPSPVQAHPDPPAPPLFVERLTALAAVVVDDTDPVGPGEIFLDWFVIPPPAHAIDAGGRRIPAAGTTSVTSPPAANLLPAGLVIWNMLNCDPLERPFVHTIVMRDDDAPLGFEDLINVTVPLPAGVSFVATPLGFVVFSFTWFQAPQRNNLCEAEEPEAGQGPLPLEPATSFSPAEPGPYAFLQPTESVTFTFTFTNTFVLTDTFVFDVDVPLLAVPAASELDAWRSLGTVISGTASWGAVTTPGASAGLELGPGDTLQLELLVTIPAGTPFGYYQLGIGGTSQTFALGLVPEPVILEVRDQPLIPGSLSFMPAVSR
jgi:hypothetical protein